MHAHVRCICICMRAPRWKQLLDGERQRALVNEVNDFGFEYTRLDWDAVPDSAHFRGSQ